MKAQLVGSGRWRGRPWRVFREGGRFRGQIGATTTDPPSFAVLGRWHDSERDARAGVRADVDRQPKVQPGEFTGWRWPPVTARRLANGPTDYKKRGAAGAPPVRTYTEPRGSNPKQSKRAASDGGETLSRSPVAIEDLAHVSEHGHVSDLTFERRGQTHRIKFKGPLPLLTWSPRARALVWVHGPRTPAKRDGAADRGAAAAFAKFHKREPDAVRKLQRPQISGRWQRLGDVVQIGYLNHEKWGKPAEHDFTSNVRAYRIGGLKPPALYVLVGGRLRITPDGIEG